MSRTNDIATWTVQQALVRLSNPWLVVIGERLKTPDGQELDYWRIERADSAIIVPVWRQQLVLSPATYRPGLGAVTLDFPGGRVSPGQTPLEAAEQILQRELDIQVNDIQTLSSLNQEGWPVNSSLSNQRLFGFWANLNESSDIAARKACQRLPLSEAGIAQLLTQMTCLQCRAVLMTLQQQLDL